jgi:hypothetical protein
LIAHRAITKAPNRVCDVCEKRVPQFAAARVGEIAGQVLATIICGVRVAGGAHDYSVTIRQYIFKYAIYSAQCGNYVGPIHKKVCNWYGRGSNASDEDVVIACSGRCHGPIETGYFATKILWVRTTVWRRRAGLSGQEVALKKESGGRLEIGGGAESLNLPMKDGR